MRDLFKTIKENFILLLGTGLFTYGLFGFTRFGYVYSDTSLILLAIGAILIVIGLLKMRIKKDKN